jgi:hypothetical protein
MGRIGITYEDVEGAIAELQGKQKHATVDNVRAILGTGSKSTIARFLREWKSRRGLNSQDENRLPSELLAIVMGLWDALCGKADTQVQESRQEAETKVATIQQQLSHARHLEAELRLKIHTLEETLHQQAEEIRLLKAQLITETQEKIRITERAAAFDARCNENRAENQRLHQLLNHVQENLEHYQTSTQRLREEQSFLTEKQRNEYEQKLAARVAQVNVATAEKAALQAELTQFKKAYDLLENEHQGMTTQYAEIRSQYESLKMTQDKIQQDYDARDRQNQLQATELAALQRTVMELQLTLKARDEKIVSIDGLLTSAHEKIETLRHDNQFTLQEKASLSGQLKQLQAMMASSRVLAKD